MVKEEERIIGRYRDAAQVPKGLVVLRGVAVVLILEDVVASSRKSAHVDVVVIVETLKRSCALPEYLFESFELEVLVHVQAGTSPTAGNDLKVAVGVILDHDEAGPHLVFSDLV